MSATEDIVSVQGIHIFVKARREKHQMDLKSLNYLEFNVISLEMETWKYVCLNGLKAKC